MSARYDYLVKLASLSTMALVAIMISAKAWAWLASGSAAMMGSLTDSLLDFAATLMSFFVLRYALKPADDDHKFGHGKAEALAGLGQAAFIAGSASLLSFHAIERIINPKPIVHSELGIWVSLFAIACTLTVVLIQQYVVRRTQSIAITADSLHYKGDLLLNAAVMLALLLTYLGYAQMDPIFAIGVAVYLLVNAWQVAKESADHLMDKELNDSQVQDIKAQVLAHQDVHGVHAIRTRQAGKVTFVQMHIELDDDLPLIDAHRISDQVEAQLHQSIEGDTDIIIHQDPCSVVPASRKGKD